MKMPLKRSTVHSNNVLSVAGNSGGNMMLTLKNSIGYLKSLPSRATNVGLRRVILSLFLNGLSRIVPNFL